MRVESLADLVFLATGAYVVLPALPLSAWLVAWVCLIVICKISGYASGFVMRKRLISLHAPANKASGLLVFLSIPAMALTGSPLPAIPACAVATFAAIQEGHLIRTGDARFR